MWVLSYMLVFGHAHLLVRPCLGLEVGIQYILLYPCAFRRSLLLGEGYYVHELSFECTVLLL